MKINYSLCIPNPRVTTVTIVKMSSVSSASITQVVEGTPGKYVCCNAYFGTCIVVVYIVFCIFVSN